MWIKMVFTVYMSITVTDREDDGTYNYMITTADKQKEKAISISTKDPIPYKIGESFRGKVTGECSEAWEINDSWVTNKSFICNAYKIETNIGTYTNYGR